MKDILNSISLGITSYSCNMVYSKQTFIHGTFYSFHSLPFPHILTGLLVLYPKKLMSDYG